MLAPTAEAVRDRLPDTVDLATVGYPTPGGSGADLFEIPVAKAVRMFELITGRDVEDLATKDEPLARSAIDGLALLAAYEGSSDRLEAIADFDLIQSFTAGSYTEERRDPADPTQRRITAWPWLNDTLWLLMTDEKRAWWLAFIDPENAQKALDAAGMGSGGWGVQEVDWDVNATGYLQPDGYDPYWW